jgi:hypothetical protein
MHSRPNARSSSPPSPSVADMYTRCLSLPVRRHRPACRRGCTAPGDWTYQSLQSGNPAANIERATAHLYDGRREELVIRGKFLNALLRHA